MASPALVRVALVVSSAVTGGSIYYYFSDGGDMKVAEEKAQDIKNRVLTESEKLSTEGLEQAKQIYETAIDKVKTTSQSILSSTSTSTSTSSTSTCMVRDIQGDAGTNSKRKSWTNCHTCSGPRIWFFTDRMRVKRRFTPYPDPEPTRD